MAGARSSGAIQLLVERQPDAVEVSVTDQGTGIDERDGESVLARYGRGDKALEHGIKGHWLGLFSCTQIVEARNGQIYARRVPGGSRVAFNRLLTRNPFI